MPVSTSRTALLSVLLTTLSAVATPTSALAMPPEPPAQGQMHPPRSPLLHGIVLSASQQSQLQALLAKQPPPAKPQPSPELTALITAPQFDSQAARVLIAQQQATQAEAMLAHLALEQQIYALLTPAQQEQARANLARPPQPRGH
ncbi:Spy/CpxP family protein refolding chaperone [Chitinibacter sp. ZOR0017]|uniref:Spy/CpxP family protein refolding chaperone n=1 Tax=Chitinibacter sp. ZOR0017 TaxID=1339254 RepID=UPI000646AC0D|nr:Spy/CpxP family protein refolding chaperone [Chitinibacter sp. ZOR0017]